MKAFIFVVCLYPWYICYNNVSIIKTMVVHVSTARTTDSHAPLTICIPYKPEQNFDYYLIASDVGYSTHH